MHEFYPAGPSGVPAAFTAPPPDYARRAWIASVSLIVFMLFYVALALWFSWTAYRLFSAIYIGEGNVIVHGLVGIAALVLAGFMLKALFFVRRGAIPDAVEVTARDQPRLFAFLHRLADEAGAPRPHRVFLTPEVNAAVFHDVSLVNMAFPSRKNLNIGLALVNSLTLSELKAVLAHEFGHFAQRSMVIGSWVTIAGQIAAQVVAMRGRLDRELRDLSGRDIRIAWIGWVLRLVVWSIRSVMETLLSIVVLSQRALSREMEFHADLVAVSLTGSDELVNSLHKLSAADEAWGNAIAFLRSEVSAGRRPEDLFALHTRMIGILGRIYDDPHYGGVPPAPTEVRPEDRRLFRSAFARPPQMWSTHPANADRERNAKRVYVPAVHDPRSAWVLFDDAAGLKERALARVLGDAAPKCVPSAQALDNLEAHFCSQRYDTRYRGAYLGRSISRHARRPEDLVTMDSAGAGVSPAGAITAALDALYPETLAADLRRLRELSEERSLLEGLRDRRFEPTGGQIVFRGNAISRRDLPAAIDKVTEEENTVRTTVCAHDRACRDAHLAAAAAFGGGWDEYLRGLIRVVHYAEHAAADLRDAWSSFHTVFAVVTADRNISSFELERLVAAGNDVLATLRGIHDCRHGVRLDELLMARCADLPWSAMLGDCPLPDATTDNMSSWLEHAPTQVERTVQLLDLVGTAALEHLLLTEHRIRDAWPSGTFIRVAPAPSRVECEYDALLPGLERPKQTRLGWWDRFQTADGLIAGVARSVVALAIVGGALFVSMVPIKLF